MTSFMFSAIGFMFRHAFMLVAMSCYAAGFKEEAIFFAALTFYLRLDDLLQVISESRAISITVGVPKSVTPEVAEGETK